MTSTQETHMYGKLWLNDKKVNDYLNGSGGASLESIYKRNRATTWTNDTEYTPNIVEICYGNGVYVAVCKKSGEEISTNNLCLKQTDELPYFDDCEWIQYFDYSEWEWKPISENVLFAVHVCFGNGLFIGFGGSNVVKSSNGLKWNYISNDDYVQGCFDGEKFVFLSSDSKIYTTTDGETFTLVSNISQDLTLTETNNPIGASCMYYANNHYVIHSLFDANNYYSVNPSAKVFNIAISTDLTDWTYYSIQKRKLCPFHDGFITLAQYSLNNSTTPSSSSPYYFYYTEDFSNWIQITDNLETTEGVNKNKYYYIKNDTKTYINNIENMFIWSAYGYIFLFEPKTDSNSTNNLLYTNNFIDYHEVTDETTPQQNNLSIITSSNGYIITSCYGIPRYVSVVDEPSQGSDILSKITYPPGSVFTSQYDINPSKTLGCVNRKWKLINTRKSSNIIYNYYVE